ncbi:hypothetical protein D3C71_920760 [compost metagenome]
MLPHVQPQNGHQPLHQGTVLVGAAHHLQAARLVHHQPGPAAAEAAQGRLGEGLLEGIQAPQIPGNRLGQLTARLTAPLRAHHLPEQAVVGMTATMIAHRPLHAHRQAVETGEQFVHRQGRQLGELGQGGIEVGDIGLVVTAVVDLHGQRVYVRLQRVIGVAEGRQGMAHVRSLSCWAQCNRWAGSVWH